MGVDDGEGGAELVVVHAAVLVGVQVSHEGPGRRPLYGTICAGCSLGGHSQTPPPPRSHSPKRKRTSNPPDTPWHPINGGVIPNCLGGWGGLVVLNPMTRFTHGCGTLPSEGPKAGAGLDVLGAQLEAPLHEVVGGRGAGGRRSGPETTQVVSSWWVMRGGEFGIQPSPPL